MATTPNYGLKLLDDTADVSVFPSNDRFNMNKIDTELGDVSDSLKATRFTSIASNTDLNSLTDPGFYGCSSAAVAGTLINSPVTSSNFTMAVTKKSNTLAVQQIIAGRHIYIRNQSSSGWSDWYDHGALYDGLDMENAGYALDAKQGSILKGLVDGKPNIQVGFVVGTVKTATIKMNSAFRGIVFSCGVNSSICGAWMLCTNDAATNVGIIVEIFAGSAVGISGSNATKTFTNSSGSYNTTLYVLCLNGNCTVTVND